MSLIALIQDIKARTDLRDYDEASTKQGIVLAILNKLDWDTFSRDEVYPEYPLDEKKLDFALRIREKNKVFIEAKKPAADLEHHEEQLLTYAFKHTVRLAVLTSGLSWWFYLPLKEGPWNERKFFAIDIENQSPEDVTKNFEAFLRKDRVLSGEAVTSAEQLLEGQTRRKRAQETLPRAWREMVNPPDELLVDLISEKVESLCGYKPDESQVVNFLKKLSEPTPRPPKKRVSGREHVGGAPPAYQVKVREKARKERQDRASNADYTRFDIQIGDEAHQSMWKRNAIFLICKHLCEKGVNPDEITALFDDRKRVWYSVDGVVDASEFERLASEKASSIGPNFDRHRWFCGDGELVQANEKTYAFSNQWGDPNWHRSMGLLKENYPQFKIDFSPSP